MVLPRMGDLPIDPPEYLTKAEYREAHCMPHLVKGENIQRCWEREPSLPQPKRWICRTCKHYPWPNFRI